MLKMLKF